MAEMNLAEAQLFRMLTAIFGVERVIWSMTVRAACGGELPASDLPVELDSVHWAENDRCLFTIVDAEDAPKMVLEFAPDFSSFIAMEQLDRMKKLPILLKSCGVQYVTVTIKELAEMTDPQSSLDLVSLLSAKCGVR